MIFRRTIFSALLIGLLAGLVFSLVQTLTINPIIFQAETFELEDTHNHASHSHSSLKDGESAAESWAPEEGAERNGYTILSNILAGIGYAAILLALMCQFQSQGLAKLNRLKGLVWGVAGFITFFVAPGLGLPPEIPGIEAAPVEHRQIWWLFCVCCVGAGLLVLGLAPLKIKITALLLLALPYIVYIPHSEGPAFMHPEAEAVLSLTELHRQFIIFSGFGNLVFWLVLGFISAWLLNAWVLKDSLFGGSGSKASADGDALGV